MTENTTPNTQSVETTAATQEKTFTQAELDYQINQRLARERKKYPSDEELTAFRSWKESQQTEQDRWNSLTRERDTAQGRVSSLEAELEQVKRERYVFSKGLTGEDAEFIAFKAAKLVDDKTTFEAAVDRLTAEREKKPTFDWTAPVGSGRSSAGDSLNERINNMLRGK